MTHTRSVQAPSRLGGIERPTPPALSDVPGLSRIGKTGAGWPGTQSGVLGRRELAPGVLGIPACSTDALRAPTGPQGGPSLGFSRRGSRGGQEAPSVSTAHARKVIPQRARRQQCREESSRAALTRPRTVTRACPECEQTWSVSPTALQSPRPAGSIWPAPPRPAQQASRGHPPHPPTHCGNTARAACAPAHTGHTCTPQGPARSGEQVGDGHCTREPASEVPRPGVTWYCGGGGGAATPTPRGLCECCSGRAHSKCVCLKISRFCVF